MILSARDRLVLNLLADFSLLTAKQLHAMAFGDVSHEPCRRSLQRLEKSRLINRLDFRIVSLKGGSGELVWKLSPNGLRFCKASARHRDKVGNYAHTLAIGDIFKAFKELEWAGQMDVQSYETEPYCWRTIGSVDVRPDLAVTLKRHQTTHLWIEADMGSEKVPHLKRKLEAVRDAYHSATGLDVLPKTVWVCIDTKRAELLKTLIAGLHDLNDGTADQRPASDLYAVSTFDTFKRQLQM